MVHEGENQKRKKKSEIEIIRFDLLFFSASKESPEWLLNTLRVEAVAVAVGLTCRCLK